MVSPQNRGNHQPHDQEAIGTSVQVDGRVRRISPRRMRSGIAESRPPPARGIRGLARIEDLETHVSKIFAPDRL